MSAAFQNVLGNLALGEDLQPSLEALIETARTYLVDNLIPLVGNIVRGIPEVIATLAPAGLQTGTELVQQFTAGFAQGAVSLGQNICSGITGGFGDVVSLAGQLGSSLTAVFTSLKAPLSAAAAAISTGLSGGLMSMFPAIYAAFGTLIGTIGAAVEGMLAAVSAALSATGIGIPAGLVVAAAAVALGVAIAAIVSKLGGSSKSSGKTPINSSSSASSAITDTSRSLWDYEKGSARPERKPRPSYEINQYIYSKAQTAADLMREARNEQERAVLAGV